MFKYSLPRAVALWIVMGDEISRCQISHFSPSPDIFFFVMVENFFGKRPVIFLECEHEELGTMKEPL